MSYISSNAPSSPSKFRRVNEADATLTRTKVDARAELRSMAHRKVYVSKIDSFLEDFVPNTSTSKKAVPDIFDGAPTTFSSEKAMYHWLCERLNKSRQFKGKKFVVTGYKPDPNDETRQAIDCGMYVSTSAPSADWTALGEESRRNIWSALELGIECKLMATVDPLDERQDDDEPTAQARKDVWAQLLSYAALVFKFQKRLFHYIVIFFGRYARIIRFDHSGIVATEKIDYTTDGARLTEFFVRYGRYGEANRGHDPTAVRIDPKDEEMAELAAAMREYGREAEEKRPKDHVPPLFNKTLDEKWPWWKLEVYDEVTDSIRVFAVGKPHFYAGGIVGRGTCGYIAVPLDDNDKPTPLRISKDAKSIPLNKDADPATADVKSEGSRDVYFVYLKDAWRVNHPGIEKEGAVLLALNRKQVQYIPTMLFHGDLDQGTLSYDKWAIYHPKEDPRDCPLKAHQHYRLVVAEVGKPLSEFANGIELVTAILCCVVAHKEACQAGYIHRDISAGNILLYVNEDGNYVGLLNDWELSRVYTDGKTDVGNRQVDRTGTWQFTSVHALINSSRVIMIPDDLESLFHVMLYFAIRFLPHNCTNGVGQLLVGYFDDYTDGIEYRTSGPVKYSAMHHGEIDITLFTGGKKNGNPSDTVKRTLEFYMPKKSVEPSAQDPVTTQPTRLHPINALIAELLGWFKALYALDKKEQTVTEDAPPADGPPRAEPALFLSRMKPRISANPHPSTSTPTSTASAGNDNLGELSRKLESHDAMEELLFWYVTKKDWPVTDKVPDMKPKNGYSPPKDNIPATSTKIGSKRVLEDGPAEPEQKSKRIRSKARG